MRRSKRALLAAGLVAGAAAMTGCASVTRPVATPAPAADERATAAPATAAPEVTASEAEEQAGEEAGELPLRVGEQEAETGALAEDDLLFLPLEETGRLLGWEPKRERAQDGAQERESVALEREGSRITVTWAVSDNTIRQITWQKDGLLVPVDAKLTSVGETVYAPVAFFEEAMGVRVSRTADGVQVDPPEPKATPETAEQDG